MRHRTIAQLSLGALLALTLALGAWVVGVRAAGTPPLQLVPPGGAGTFPAAFFGMHVHNDDRRRNWPDVPIGSLRLWDANLNWMGLEPSPGRWDFSRLDEYLAWAERRKVEVLLPLGLTPQWASARPEERGAYGLGTAAEPADIELWRNYVRRVATHAKGRVAAYQVGNEANLRDFFSGTPEMLVRMTEIARAEIRRQDPTARLVAPSGAGLDNRVGWLVQMLDRGLKGSVDVVALHLYHEQHPPEIMIEPVQRMLAMKAAAGHAAIPIWNTETGYWMPNPRLTYNADEARGTVSVETAAQFLPRDMLLARALGFERYYWYAWDNGKMGFIDPQTGKRRPMADVYAQFIQEFRGATLQRCARDDAGVWTCNLTAADGRAMQARWMDAKAPSQQRSLAVGAGRSLVLDGRSTWQPVSSELEVTPTVVLWKAS